MRTSRWLRLGLRIAGWAIVGVPTLFAQIGNQGAASATVSSVSSSAVAVSRTVRGRVTNALDGLGVPRTLVQLNNRSVLTDSQGQFEFREFTDTQAYMTLIKPGYSQTNNATMGVGRQRIKDLDSTITLRLYPDATIVGTVTGRDAQPLARVPISLQRGVFDQGSWRWVTIHAAQTGLHGDYRFRERSGRFRISLNYVARTQDTGQSVLPMHYPADTSSDNRSYFEVASGQERRIDLRARTGVTYPVAVQLDLQDEQRGVQFFAVTSDGEAFSVPPTGSLAQGSAQVLLPAGTYTLHARIENRESSMEGSARLTVTNHMPDAVPIHMEPAAVLPVELSIDAVAIAEPPGTGSYSNTTLTVNQQKVDLRQFNLRLHNLSAPDLPSTRDIMLRQNEGHGYEFRVPPGRYRLMVGGGGSWYVASATAGSTNLMSSEILVGGGGSGTPIRIVASNAQGVVSGTVRVTGNEDSVWVYLIPSGPSLGGIHNVAVNLTTGSTSTFSLQAPTGAYLAVAVDNQIEDDLRNPEVIARFSTDAKPVEVSSSATASLTLEIAREKKQ